MIGGTSLPEIPRLETDMQRFAGKASPTSNKYDGLWAGRVVDRKDPKKLSRIKVRIFEIYGTEQEVPNDMLPWASPCFSFEGTWIPDLNSLVWVAFRQGNVESPIWLGWFPHNCPDGKPKIWKEEGIVAQEVPNLPTSAAIVDQVKDKPTKERNNHVFATPGPDHLLIELDEFKKKKKGSVLNKAGKEVIGPRRVRGSEIRIRIKDEDVLLISLHEDALGKNVIRIQNKLHHRIVLFGKTEGDDGVGGILLRTAEGARVFMEGPNVWINSKEPVDSDREFYVHEPACPEDPSDMVTVTGTDSRGNPVISAG